MVFRLYRSSTINGDANTYVGSAGDIVVDSNNQILLHNNVTPGGTTINADVLGNLLINDQTISGGNIGLLATDTIEMAANIIIVGSGSTQTVLIGGLSNVVLGSEVRTSVAYSPLNIYNASNSTISGISGMSGDTVFNTDSHMMNVYDGSEWLQSTVPSQSGQSGNILSTDGSSLVWVTNSNSGQGIPETVPSWISMGYGYPPLITASSSDGDHWTNYREWGGVYGAGISQSILNDIAASNGANLNFYNVAVGNGAIVYLNTYNYTNTNLWTAKTPDDFPQLQQSLLTVPFSGSTSPARWTQVRFAGGYFIAVGHTQSDSPVPAPIFAYSVDGYNWVNGSIDYDYIFNTLGPNFQPENEPGFELDDVDYNGEGWLFVLNYNEDDGSLIDSPANPGGFYITSLSDQLGSANYVNGIPTEYAGLVAYDGDGWVATDYSNNIFVNTSYNPGQGQWSNVNIGQTYTDTFGVTHSIKSVTAGKISGTDYIVIGNGYGQILASSDQGNAYIGSIPNPSFGNITTIDTTTYSNQVWVTTTYNDEYNDGEVVKITDTQGVTGLNGTYYVAAQNNDGTDGYILFTDPGLSQPYPASSISGDYVSNSALLTWSHGGQIDYLAYGGGKFVALLQDYLTSYWCLYSSTDAQNWKKVSDQSGYWEVNAIAHGNITNVATRFINNSNTTQNVAIATSMSLDNDFSVDVNSVRFHLDQATGGFFLGSDYKLENNPNGTNTYQTYITTIPTETFASNQIQLSVMGNIYAFGTNGSLQVPISTPSSPLVGEIIDYAGNPIVKDIPQVPVSGSVTLEWQFRGYHLLNTGGSTCVCTIPSNSSLPFPIGTAITLVSSADYGFNIVPDNSETVAIVVPGVSNDANGYTLPINSMATLLKVGTDRWMLSGYGLTGI